MSGSEFGLIQSYFSIPGQSLLAQQDHPDIIQGIGDDCAILAPPADQHLAVSIDTLISGVHFPEQTSPQAVAHKALAVNLSDLAAMGAEPAWFTLALTLPDNNRNWLELFSQSLFKLAAEYQIPLIGGDTTSGDLAVTIQIAGYVPPDSALKRSGAQAGDIIVLTGALGAAAIGLDIVLEQNRAHYQCLSETRKKAARLALNYPCPRIKEGRIIRQYGHSALDISDGLLADLGHILTASEVGAEVFLEQLPLSETLACLKLEQKWEKALTGGDDYELCFTLSRDKWQVLKHFHPRFTAIGHITESRKLRCLTADGEIFELQNRGYNHFD